MDSTVPSAVTVKHLRKSFAGGLASRVCVLEDISFSIRRGEIVGVIGPSGCGKSTLLRILCGILPFDSGGVYLLDRPDGNRKGYAAYVPQGTALLDWQTLWNNALLGWRIARGRAEDARLTQRAQALFDRFGLTKMVHRYPDHCSGGECQRAALIRALLTPAPLLVLDEPVAAIDHMTRAQIYETLFTIVEDKGQAGRELTVVIVSHDPEELLFLCDRILVISQRPATIIKTLDVPFSRPRDSNLKFTSAFVDFKKALWELLS
jgi:putative hydroxymethylpyrimidine transport system ATP-binding protein